MKAFQIATLIATAIIASIVTRIVASKTGLIPSNEPFASIPGVPDILNHLSIDDSNVDRDDTDFTKRTVMPAFVVSGLQNGLTVNKMIGVKNMKQNRNGLRITNGPDAASSPCWGVDYAANTLLLRHYPEGFHPPSFSEQSQYDSYYDRWNWFLRIWPSTQTRYTYPSIF